MDFINKLEVSSITYPISGRSIEWDDEITIELHYQILIDSASYGISYVGFFSDRVVGSAILTAIGCFKQTEIKDLIEAGFTQDGEDFVIEYDLSTFRIIDNWEFGTEKYPQFCEIDFKNQWIII